MKVNIVALNFQFSLLCYVFNQKNTYDREKYDILVGMGL